MTSRSQAPSLVDWFTTPLGRYVLACERSWLDTVVPDIFGFHALQVGIAGGDLLAESRIPHRMTVDTVPGASLQARPTHLPIESDSVDLVVAAHILEFSPDPHDVIRELDRILRPEGKLILTSFNPWSLWGLTRALTTREHTPWNAQFISLPRIKDWLSLLGHDVVAGRLACYSPPFEQERWRERFTFMEPMGDRWWGVGGGVYMLVSVKRVAGVRLIRPRWADRGMQGELSAAKRAARTSVHLKIVKGGDGL
jgi:SAM-dependent methyltransferase